MDKNGKKKLTALIFVAVAAATAVFSGMNDEDEEQRKKRELTNSETTIEYLTDLPPVPEEIILAKEAPAPEVVQEAPRKSLFRSLISIPAWILGHAAKLLLAPILGKLFSWILIAAVFFGILCLCLKAIFPDKTLKELLNWKTLLTFACCTGVYIAVFNLPDILNLDGGKFEWTQLGVGVLALLTMILLSSYFIDERKKQPQEAAA